MKYGGRLLFVLALVGPLLGCGDPSAQVRGKVTLEGKPFIGTIFAQNADNGVSVEAKIMKNGAYELKSAPIGKNIKFYVHAYDIPGMPPGYAKKVLMQDDKIPLPTMTDELFKESWAPKLPTWATKEDVVFAVDSLKVDPKFTSAVSTPLTKELVSGANSPFEIELTRWVKPAGFVMPMKR